MKLFLKFILIKGILPIVVMFTLPIWILPMGILWLLFKIWESWEEYKSWNEWEKRGKRNGNQE